MGQKISEIIFLFGVVLVLISVFQWGEQQLKINASMSEAESIIKHDEDFIEKPIAVQSDETIVHNKQSEEQILMEMRNQFQPEEHDVIGILEIPKLDVQLPIIEGTDEEMLEKGVGHYRTTAFPLDDEQILLSGHRDTVFRNFDQLEVGDRFIVELPYGSFEYEMKESEIVDEDDTTVIRKMGQEVLTLSTCYPFRYIGNAPQRYVIYAYPVFE